MGTVRALLDLIVVCVVARLYAPARQYLLLQGGHGMAVVHGLSSSWAVPLNSWTNLMRVVASNPPWQRWY